MIKRLEFNKQKNKNKNKKYTRKGFHKNCSNINHY